MSKPIYVYKLDTDTILTINKLTAAEGNGFIVLQRIGFLPPDILFEGKDLDAALTIYFKTIDLVAHTFGGQRHKGIEYPNAEEYCTYVNA